MKTPIPIASIFVLYLFVVWLGPIYMKNKPALHIKWLMVLYNLGLVALSLYMFYEVRSNLRYSSVVKYVWTRRISMYFYFYVFLFLYVD